MPRKPSKKREPGLLERPPGSGRYSIRYRDEYGVQKTEVVGPITKARALLDQRKGDVAKLKLAAKSNRVTMEELKLQQTREGFTVAKMVEEYEAEFHELKSARVIAGYLAEWKARFGDRLAAHVTPGDIRAWQIEKKSLGMKGGTSNRYVAYLRRLYNLALRDSLVDSNPCGHGRVPAQKEGGGRKRVFSPEEEALILPRLEPADAAAFVLCLYSGMRQGEALGLTRDTVDLVAGTATLLDPKAGKEQTVELNGPAIAAITFMMAQHDHDLIFPNRSGSGPMSGARMTERLQKVVSDLGLPKAWFHSLRHSYVTRLGDGRTDIGTAQELARHSSVNQTRHYWHPSDDRKRAAVDSLALGFQSAGVFGDGARRGHLRAL